MAHKIYTLDEMIEVFKEFDVGKTRDLMHSDEITDQQLQNMLQLQYDLLKGLVKTAKQGGAFSERRRQATANILLEIKFFTRIEMQCRNALLELKTRERSQKTALNKRKIAPTQPRNSPAAPSVGRKSAKMAKAIKLEPSDH